MGGDTLLVREEKKVCQIFFTLDALSFGAGRKKVIRRKDTDAAPFPADNLLLRKTKKEKSKKTFYFFFLFFC